MLTGKGVTAWWRALAGLAPAASATCIAGPAGTARPASCAPAVPAHLAIELINILAALTLTGTG